MTKDASRSFTVGGYVHFNYCGHVGAGTIAQLSFDGPVRIVNLEPTLPGPWTKWNKNKHWWLDSAAQISTEVAPCARPLSDHEQCAKRVLHSSPPCKAHPIVAFVGPAGCGKDTAAVSVRAARVSFATPLKQFCQEVFAWPQELLWGPSELRDQPCPQGRLREDGQPLTPRYALQTLGTEWGRACYPRVWVEAGLRKAQELRRSGPVVFTDARFANELAALREIGGVLVKVERPGYLPREHGSERELDSLRFDYALRNDSTLSFFQEKVRRLWAEICR